jgi:hypothetical protein
LQVFSTTNYGSICSVHNANFPNPISSTEVTLQHFSTTLNFPIYKVFWLDNFRVWVPYTCFITTRPALKFKFLSITSKNAHKTKSVVFHARVQKLYSKVVWTAHVVQQKVVKLYACSQTLFLIVSWIGDVMAVID